MSGYLITRLLVAELSESGTVRRGEFWARRARRLLPAAMVMLAAVAFVSVARFNTAQLYDLRTQLFATMLYVGNWGFIFADRSYFAAAEGSSPLLHTWSLAIEEQFYVVFPLVLLGLWRRARPAVVTGVLVAGALVSAVAMAMLYDASDPSRVYFGTDTHASALLIGAALAIASSSDRRRTRVQASRWRHDVAQALILGALVCTMWAMPPESPWLYAGGFFVFAVVCAALVATVVASPKSPIAIAMSTSLLVAIGLRSYSLYLWHWPIRVYLTEDSTRLHNLALTGVRVVALVAVAEVSYRFIERPFRAGSISLRWGTLPTVLAAGACALLVMLAAAQMPTLAPTTSLAAAIRDETARGSSATAVPADAPRIDVFGDSTAFVFGYEGAAHMRELPPMRPDGESSIGCGLVPGDHYNGSIVFPRPDYCTGWQDRWRETVRRSPPDAAVMMTGAWDVLDHQVDGKAVRYPSAEWTALLTTSVDDALDALQTSGGHVFILDVPCYGNGPPDSPVPPRAEPARQQAVNRVFAEAAAKRPGVSVLGYRDFICPGGQLRDVIDGTSMFDVDNVHLSKRGAVVVWRWLFGELQKVLPPG